MSQTDQNLSEEVRRLREEVARLNDHKFLRTYNSTWKFLAFNFAKGVAVALGGIIGATVVLSWVIWSLSQIEFIPIIGEYAHQLIEIVRASEEGAAVAPPEGAEQSEGAEDSAPSGNGDQGGD